MALSSAAAAPGTVASIADRAANAVAVRLDSISLDSVSIVWLSQSDGMPAPDGAFRCPQRLLRLASQTTSRSVLFRELEGGSGGRYRIDTPNPELQNQREDVNTRLIKRKASVRAFGRA
jgi:hypothetical protein